MLDVAAGRPPAGQPDIDPSVPQDPSIPGLQVPDLPQRHYVPPAHYAVAVIDGHGRMAITSPLNALGWTPGTIIEFSVDSNRVVTATRSATESPQHSIAPCRAITPRGHLNLPILTRRRAGICNRDHLLLAADNHTGLLWIYPPKVLALILQPYTSLEAKQP